MATDTESSDSDQQLTAARAALEKSRTMKGPI